MDLLETILSRRSIRSFTSEPVSDESIQKILEAAMAAPSANNYQPWQFVVITDANLLKQLADAHPYGKMLAQARAGIAVIGEPEISPKYWIQDCSAATENILLAITALRLGGVWLGVYPQEDRVAAIREILKIPPNHIILNIIALGHPAEHKSARTQFNPQKIHLNTW